MSDFITIKVYAERTAFGPFGRPYTTTTNEVDEIIVPISRIVQVTPKNDIKCLVDIDTPDGVDTRWCVMSAAEVMSLISSASTHDDDTCPHLVRANLLESENARLKAEVERLTKAGDAMAGSHITLIQVYLKDSSDEWHQELHNRWNAAKEGKGQP